MVWLNLIELGLGWGRKERKKHMMVVDMVMGDDVQLTD